MTILRTELSVREISLDKIGLDFENELYPTADISGYEKGIVKDYFYKIDEITGKRVKIF